MISPDAILFAPQPRHPRLQSRPTHVVRILWRAEGFTPHWLVMIREDGTATVLDRDPNVFRDNTLSAVVRALAELGLEVVSGGIDLGHLPPSAPLNTADIFPGEKEFAEILVQPGFIPWVKDWLDEAARA